MMHEIAVSMVKVAESSRFGQTESYLGRTTGRDFGNGPRPVHGSAPMAGWVPAKYLHSFCGLVINERCVCSHLGGTDLRL